MESIEDKTFLNVLPNIAEVVYFWGRKALVLQKNFVNSQQVYLLYIVDRYSMIKRKLQCPSVQYILLYCIFLSLICKKFEAINVLCTFLVSWYLAPVVSLWLFSNYCLHNSLYNAFFEVHVFVKSISFKNKFTNFCEKKNHYMYTF